jgi:hypothetical protein
MIKFVFIIPLIKVDWESRLESRALPITNYDGQGQTMLKIWYDVLELNWKNLKFLIFIHWLIWNFY